MGNQLEFEIGTQKFTRNKVEKLYYSNRRYIATYSKIYVIKFSTASNMFYVTQIYSSPTRNKHFTKKGEVLVGNETEINQKLGFKLLNEA